jgi:hypothetical protein
MNVYDEAMSEEKRNAHRGVIQQLNRSVTRSAPKPAIPQIVDKFGVPPVQIFNQMARIKAFMARLGQLTQDWLETA